MTAPHQSDPSPIRLSANGALSWPSTIKTASERVLIRVIANPRSTEPPTERFSGRVVLVDANPETPTAAIVSTIRASSQAGDAQTAEGYLSAQFKLLPDTAALLRVPAEGGALLEFVTTTGCIHNLDAQTLNLSLGRVQTGPLPLGAHGFNFSLKTSADRGERAFHWRAPKRPGYLLISVVRS